MSELFLDTWFDDQQIDQMASALCDLPFETEQLTRMFETEVAPACGINLLDVAGEWAGFDRDWLFQRINNLSYLDRLTACTKSMTQWEEVLNRIIELRATR